MKHVVAVFLAFFIVSCTPLATGTPALTSQLSPTISSPTETATVVATPIPIIPKQQFTLGFIEVPLPAQELIQAGIETGVIRQALDVDQLRFEVHENLNKPGGQIVFGRDPQTNEILLATRADPGNGKLTWHVAGLRDIADAAGMSMGTQLYSPNNGLFSHSDIQKINALVVQEYNHAIVIEVGWGVWLEKSQEGDFDFSLSDQAVDLALANGMTVEGDDLIYGLSDYKYSYMGQIDDQLRNEGLNDQQVKERIEGIVKNHIRTIMTHYKGRITEWSVLNEWRGQNTENPDLYSRVWNKAGSSDQEFIKMVFQIAKESDPAARLFYNDNDINTPKHYGYPYAFSNVRMLRELGLIDAVGIQMTDIFVASPPDQNQIITTMQSWGLPAIVSSATFQVQDMVGTEQEIQNRQADVAVQMLDACIKSAVCKGFRMWDGYGDKFAFQGPDAKSTIFDKDMKPKPAYFAIKEYLTQLIDQGKK